MGIINVDYNPTHLQMKSARCGQFLPYINAILEKKN